MADDNNNDDSSSTSESASSTSALSKVKTEDELAALLKCKVEALDFVALLDPLTKCRNDNCPYPTPMCNYGYCVLCGGNWYPRVRHSTRSKKADENGLIKDRGHYLLGEQFANKTPQRKTSCSCDSDDCFGIGHTDSFFAFPSNNDTHALECWLEALGGDDVLSPAKREKIRLKPRMYQLAYWHFDPKHLEVQQQITTTITTTQQQASFQPKLKFKRAESYTDAAGKVWNTPKHPPPNYDLQKFIRSARASQQVDRAERAQEGELPEWLHVMRRAETTLARCCSSSLEQFYAPTHKMAQKEKKRADRFQQQVQTLQAEKTKTVAEYEAEIRALQSQNQTLQSRIDEKDAEIARLNGQRLHSSSSNKRQRREQRQPKHHQRQQQHQQQHNDDDEDDDDDADEGQNSTAHAVYPTYYY